MDLNWQNEDKKVENSKPAKFKYVHDRPGCISCGACAAINPDKWAMNKEDGKADLLDANFDEDKNGIEMETAESCPVNVIHVYEGDKKLI